MAEMYRVRLAPGKLGFYCPKTNLHLYYPQKIEGEVSASADLTNIKRAVKSGRLIEVPLPVVKPQETQSPQPAVKSEPVEDQAAGEPEVATVEADASAEEDGAKTKSPKRSNRA